MRRVRCATATATISGDGMIEKFRKKCSSASQATSKPSWSASTICSIVSW
jgi:hypothetical protein